jgi:short-subunit dehydrogenase
MDKLIRGGALSSPEVAKIAYHGMMAGKRVVLPGLATKFIAWTSPFTPKALAMAMVGMMQLGRREKEIA